MTVFFLIALTADECPDTGIGEDGDADEDHEVYVNDADGDGSTEKDGDCNDTDADVGPDAKERCNDLDDNCNGAVDEDAVDAVTWYADIDGDGYGDAASATSACAQPEGYIEIPDDCDDEDPEIYPGAAEICNNVDDDCDGRLGDGTGDSLDESDADGDGFPACKDCDDGNLEIYPGADEYCDEIDQDCDGEFSESDAVDADTWYADIDGDRYGSEDVLVHACSMPFYATEVGGDCDDFNKDTYPGAEEVCDGEDNDCDSTTPLPDSEVEDADSDGYPSCMDCDESDPSIHPNAEESEDEVDSDCDGAPD